YSLNPLVVTRACRPSRVAMDLLRLLSRPICGAATSCPADGTSHLVSDAPAHPRCLRIGLVRSDSRLRCRPVLSKLSGANHVRKAWRRAGHSVSMAAYQAVSRLRPL